MFSTLYIHLLTARLHLEVPDLRQNQTKLNSSSSPNLRLSSASGPCESPSSLPVRSARPWAWTPCLGCCHGLWTSLPSSRPTSQSILHISAKGNFRQCKVYDLHTWKSFTVSLLCIGTKIQHLPHPLFQLIPTYPIGLNMGLLFMRSLPSPPNLRRLSFQVEPVAACGPSTAAVFVILCANDSFVCQCHPVDSELLEDRVSPLLLHFSPGPGL